MIPDTAGVPGSLLAGRLALRGHMIHSCKLPGQVSGCAVLEERPCPLESEPVDVVVCTGGPGAPWDRGDGSTCAVTHRVPLVMVDADPTDPLVGFAAALTTQEDAVEIVEAVGASPLPVHSRIASGVLRAELRRLGLDPESSYTSVEVHRRSGTLVVEMSRGAGITRAEAERVATHIVQALREHDGWARGVDVTVHDRAGSGH